jgi:hypothetical protein
MKDRQRLKQWGCSVSKLVFGNSGYSEISTSVWAPAKIQALHSMDPDLTARRVKLVVSFRYNRNYHCRV